MTIELGKKYQTRGSWDYPSKPVRIVCVDVLGAANYCVLGLVTEDYGSFKQEYEMVWTKEGRADTTQEISEDLVPFVEA